MPDTEEQFWRDAETLRHRHVVDNEGMEREDWDYDALVLRVLANLADRERAQ